MLSVLAASVVFLVGVAWLLRFVWDYNNFDFCWFVILSWNDLVSWVFVVAGMVIFATHLFCKKSRQNQLFWWRLWRSFKFSGIIFGLAACVIFLVGLACFVSFGWAYFMSFNLARGVHMLGSTDLSGWIRLEFWKLTRSPRWFTGFIWLSFLNFIRWNFCIFLFYI